MSVTKILEMFDRSVSSRRSILEDLVDDAEEVSDEARAFLSQIAPDLAYSDKAHPFAESLFYCAINLALYKALEKRGVDVHVFGAAMLKDLEERENATSDASEDTSTTDGALGEFPPRGDHPGEFDVEVIHPEEGDRSFSLGYNVKSCAICYLFGQYDAMDLVPYMCASDDVISDAVGQRLKRSGTIALGAHQCDFRFGGKEEPKRVADHYAERIKFVHS